MLAKNGLIIEDYVALNQIFEDDSMTSHNVRFPENETY